MCLTAWITSQFSFIFCLEVKLPCQRLIPSRGSEVLADSKALERPVASGSVQNHVCAPVSSMYAVTVLIFLLIARDMLTTCDVITAATLRPGVAGNSQDNSPAFLLEWSSQIKRHQHHTKLLLVYTLTALGLDSYHLIELHQMSTTVNTATFEGYHPMSCRHSHPATA